VIQDSSEELVSERYAVHAIPMHETNGCRRSVLALYKRDTKSSGRAEEKLTIWNWIGITRKLRICTAGHSTKLAFKVGK
jgi:hypothetical protein